MPYQHRSNSNSKKVRSHLCCYFISFDPISLIIFGWRSFDHEFVCILCRAEKPKGSAITTSSCNKSMGSSYEHWNLDGGSFRGSSRGNKFGRNAHNLSSTSLRKRSNLVIVSKVRWGVLRQALANLQEVVLGTKLSILFPVIPLVIVAQRYNFGSVSVRVFSLIFFFF